MKKNIIKIGLLSILGFGAVVSMNSCRDAVDIVQDGELNSDAFFTTVDNLQGYLVGSVYNNVENAQAVYFTSLITDEVKPAAGSGGQGYETHRFYIDPSRSIVSDIWLQNNLLINRATRLIEGAKKVTPSSSEQATYNNIVAEAKVLRALGYLQLLTYFSPDMANDNALGTMIISTVPGISTKLPRSTNGAVYAVIEEDLTFAENHLTKQSDRYYVSKNLVNAIKARLYLYRGKYAEAKQYAQAVLSSSGLSLTAATPIPSGTVGSTAWNADFYKDASISPYRQIWSDNSQGEVIFALSRPVSGGSYVQLPSYYNTNKSEIAGSPLWVMGRNLFNILDGTTGDIRRYAYIDPTSTINPNYQTAYNNKDYTTDQIVIDKYPGKGSASTKNDVKMFRLSEMYFILAECAVNDSDLVSAGNYIQQVRQARNYLGAATTPTYANQQAAWADILKERRVELAFEGHRYIDLKRLAVKAGVTMDRNNTDDRPGITVENLPNGHYKYTLPIPLSEIAGNPNIQQNHGY